MCVCINWRQIAILQFVVPGGPGRRSFVLCCRLKKQQPEAEERLCKQKPVKAAADKAAADKAAADKASAGGMRFC